VIGAVEIISTGSGSTHSVIGSITTAVVGITVVGCIIKVVSAIKVVVVISATVIVVVEDVVELLLVKVVQVVITSVAVVGWITFVSVSSPPRQPVPYSSKDEIANAVAPLTRRLR
jgi:hypothetical protein